nr:hypothetical protein [Tanacetum cinerariifolium]
MPIICTACGGIVRGGLCLPSDLREKNLYNYDPNAYSFNNSNYFPQPQDENYLCNLCGNNSHDGYDCQQQFSFVYEQEPSYNQNYDDNCYPHESLSFSCCDYCGGSHETFQCQLDNQNVEFSGSDQIQTPQYPDVNPPSPEIRAGSQKCCRATDHKNRTIQSLQNFRVIHKSFISLNTSQISLIHSVAPIQSTKEPEHLLSMGYEHFSITPGTKYHEVTESNAENLLPILSKYEVTLEDEIECDMPAKDVCSPVFTTFSNHLFKVNDNFDSSDDESLPDEDVLDGNSQQEEINNVTETDDVLPPSDENDDDLLNDSLLEEADLFLVSDNSIPPDIENVANDPEGDIRFLEELLIDNFILSHELSDSNFEDNPLISRPPPEPPDDNFDLEPEVISIVMEDIDEPDEHFNLGGEIFVSTKIEDDDYFPFMFVIRFFLPYFIFFEISPLLLFAERLSLEIEVILCRIYVWFSRSSYPLIDFSLGKSISF